MASVVDKINEFVANDSKYSQVATDHWLLKYKNSKEHDAYLATFNADAFLGRGGFGEVYAINSWTLQSLNYSDKERVIKVIILPVCQDEKKELMHQIETEYLFCKKAGHLGIKPPIFIEEQNKAFLVMKKLPGKELFTLINDCKIERLGDKKRLQLTYKLLCALRDQVTDRGIIHRDIKEENIMVKLAPEMHVNIIDYGVATGSKEQDSLFAGSSFYKAPEILKHEEYGVACDVFSLAKVIGGIWMKNSEDIPKWQKTKAEKCASLVARKLGRSRKRHYQKVIEMLEKMLDKNQSSRLTIHQAIIMIEENYSHLLMTEISEDIKRSSSVIPKTNAGRILHQLQDIIDEQLFIDTVIKNYRAFFSFEDKTPCFFGSGKNDFSAWNHVLLMAKEKGWKVEELKEKVEEIKSLNHFSDEKRDNLSISLC